jgi:hypothetical protein
MLRRGDFASLFLLCKYHELQVFGTAPGSCAGYRSDRPPAHCREQLTGEIPGLVLDEMDVVHSPNGLTKLQVGDPSLGSRKQIRIDSGARYEWYTMYW